ncbi:MAG TPA: response regulator [Chloroflexi bacterium]|jgi:PAS domain S-box-containing protein|nr:response regulator [Chloroflexota bacterium]
MVDARVLIVEDDGITARYVQGCLRGHGYGATTVVASGSEALRQAATLEPDLMVVDIRLRDEDLDGVETVRRVRERSNVPVIYLTGYSDDDTVRRADATGPQGYLVKPFLQRELVAAVDAALHDHLVQRRAEPTTTTHDAPYRSIVESQVEMVCRLDADGTITFANAACRRAFGYRDALVGASYWSLIALPDRANVRQRLALLSQNRPAEVHEHRALALDPVEIARDAGAPSAVPELRWQQWSVRAFFGPAGEIVGYQAVGRDVTERRRRDEARDQRLVELQEALDRRQPARGLVPICASCKRIRNPKEEWEVLESYLRDHYRISFTHGICPECMERLYPDDGPEEPDADSVADHATAGQAAVVDPPEPL